MGGICLKLFTELRTLVAPPPLRHGFGFENHVSFAILAL